MQKNNYNRFLARLTPYLMLGVMIVLFVIGLFIFSYVLIFSVIVGLILFGIAYIRTRFFMHKKRPLSTQHHHQGRVIDHDKE